MYPSRDITIAEDAWHTIIEYGSEASADDRPLPLMLPNAKPATEVEFVLGAYGVGWRNYG